MFFGNDSLILEIRAVDTEAPQIESWKKQLSSHFLEYLVSQDFDDRQNGLVHYLKLLPQILIFHFCNWRGKWNLHITRKHAWKLKMFKKHHFLEQRMYQGFEARIWISNFFCNQFLFSSVLFKIQTLVEQLNLPIMEDLKFFCNSLITGISMQGSN